MSDALITLKDISVRFGEKTVLNGISLDIFPNEITVILGESGCGKSTLLKTITGLIKPETGSIHIFGEPFDGADESKHDQMLRRMGVLFQNGALLNSVTIRDNVAIPLEQHSRLDPDLIDKNVAVKLKWVGLSEAAYLLPSELSGGMKKRAALARAIILDPEILFCDEPSAGLDPVTSASLDQLILTIKEQFNMTIIVVSHELASIHRIADKIIYLDKGKILYNGSLKNAHTCHIETVENFFRTGSF